MWSIDWQQGGGLVAVVSAVGGVVLLLVRSSMHGVFADRKSYEALVARMTAAENRLAETPNGEDMRELYRRVNGIEVGLAANTAAVAGVGDGVKRVEHMMGLLLRNELEKAGANEPR
jgi:hypothetical protein